MSKDRQKRPAVKDDEAAMDDRTGENKTEFFHQPQAWQVLEKKVIAPLVERAEPGGEIRVWVPGCSTGKEAYSLGMALAERVEKSGKKLAVQIFATDSDVASLATARSGNYSKEEMGENISAKRLKRFFTRRDGRYQIVKELREQVVFAPQNITADPPFSRLDLISCRNLLIYLDQEVQRKIIALFHFALWEGGFLFLGSAETVGDREDLFEVESKKWRIYRRIGDDRAVGVEIAAQGAREPAPAAGRWPVTSPAPRMSLASMAQQILLDRFTPACVMIDRKLQVLYVHGSVEAYLTFPRGELTTRVVDMAREGLRARLRGAIDQCLETNRSLSVTARVRRAGKSVPVKATVSPLRYPRETDGLLLISFEDYQISTEKSRGKAAAKSDLHQLEDELKVTREELQSTIEQLESSNDQLKASNEEVTAANEELQAANEEMETSKEELQSLNEELNTINARLEEKVEELEDTNNDVVNLLSSTNIATVFLDRELKVKRYTPASTRLFSLTPSDVGRPIGDVLWRFTDETLLDDGRRVLSDLTPLSREVQVEDGRWYIRRITPYRTQDDRIEGVVVTFVDINDLKETEEALRRRQVELEAAHAEAENEKRRLEAVMEALPVGMAITDAQGGNIQSNSAFEQVWGGPRPPTHSVDDYAAYQAWWVETGKPLTAEEWASARAVQKGEAVVGQMLEIQRFDGSRAFIINSASPVRDARGNVIGSAVAVQDITDLRKTEQALREAHERAAWLARFPEENPHPVERASADGSVLYCNPAAAKLDGWACGVGRTLPVPLAELVGRAMTEGREAGEDVKMGGRFYSVWIIPFPSEGYANIYGRDISKRKQAEETVLRAKQEWERTFDAVPDLIALLDNDHRILRVNRAMAQRLGTIPEECAGKTCHQVVHGIDSPPAFCPHVLTMADGREHITEVHEDSLGGDFLVSTTPLSDEQGRRIGSVHVARDITDRIAAERELQESEARLKRSQEIAHLGSWELDLSKNQLTWSDEVYRIFGLQPQEFGATYEAFLERVYPDDRAAVNAAYSGSLREGKSLYEIEHRVIRETTGEIRWVRERCQHVADATGRIIRSLGMVLDITDLKQAEEALQRNEARSKLLSETAGRLLATDDPQGNVNELCRNVMEHLDCQVFFNFLVDESAGRLHLNACAGIPEEEMRRIEWLDYGIAVCGCVARDGTRIVAEDIGSAPDPRTDLVKSYGVKAYACHPLMVQGRLIGTLAFGTKTRTSFSLEELAVMRTVTHQVATAMERIRLIKELQRSRDELKIRVRERTVELATANETLRHLSSRLLSAHEDERRRVALEIHDTLGACLSAVKFKVESVIHHTDEAAVPGGESLKTLVPVIQESIEECRRIQMDLRPPMLDDLGLLATLSWFLRRFQTVYSKIQIEQEIEVEEDDVPHSIRVVAFRVTQEAMNNVAKHSKADQARLSLRKKDDRIELILRDNGRGFDPEKALALESTRRGLGLSSMKERVELSGGSFAIESIEGEGTTVRASWPLGEIG